MWKTSEAAEPQLAVRKQGYWTEPWRIHFLNKKQTIKYFRIIKCMAFHKMSLILSSHHIRSSKQRTPCRSCSKQLHNWLAPCSTRATKPRGEQACSTWRQVHVESLLLLETNIDDSSPQVLAYTMEELLLAGGLDVWSAPVYMKKGRPGTTLRILCKACDAENLVHLLFKVRRRFFAEPLVS